MGDLAPSKDGRWKSTAGVEDSAKTSGSQISYWPTETILICRGIASVAVEVSKNFADCLGDSI